MSRRFLPLLAGCLALGGAATASAGGYGGIALGQASIDDSARIHGGGTAVVDENALGWKVFGGWMFTDHVGIEAGWADLGDMNEGGVTDVETEGFFAGAVGRLPIGEDSGFSLHARLGLYIWDQDINQDSYDGTDVTFGIGAKYRFTDLLGVQIDWDRYKTKLETDMISVGLTLNF